MRQTYRPERPGNSLYTYSLWCMWCMWCKSFSFNLQHPTLPSVTTATITAWGGVEWRAGEGGSGGRRGGGGRVKAGGGGGAAEGAGDSKDCINCH